MNIKEGNYFWERTGPDFIHPIYTRGFERWRERVVASIPTQERQGYSTSQMIHKEKSSLKKEEK